MVDPFAFVDVIHATDYKQRCTTLLRINVYISHHWEYVLMQNLDNKVTRERAKWFTAQLQHEKRCIKSALVFAGVCTKHRTSQQGYDSHHDQNNVVNAF